LPYGNLSAEVTARNYSTESIRKILVATWCRSWGTVLAQCCQIACLVAGNQANNSDSNQSNHWFAVFAKRKSLCVKTVCVRKYFTCCRRIRHACSRMSL